MMIENQPQGSSGILVPSPDVTMLAHLWLKERPVVANVNKRGSTDTAAVGSQKQKKPLQLARLW